MAIDGKVYGVERKPFENRAGSGVEYAFGDWSALC